MSAKQQAEVSAQILALIQRCWPALENAGAAKFFLIPNPPAYPQAQQELLANTAALALETIHLPKQALAYLVQGEADFLSLLPHAFALGPPELSILALHSSQALEKAQMADFVLAALGRTKPMHNTAVCGLHFDSGDLLEVF